METPRNICILRFLLVIFFRNGLIFQHLSLNLRDKIQILHVVTKKVNDDQKASKYQKPNTLTVGKARRRLLLHLFCYLGLTHTPPRGGGVFPDLSEELLYPGFLSEE